MSKNKFKFNKIAFLILASILLTGCTGSAENGTDVSINTEISENTETPEGTNIPEDTTVSEDTVDPEDTMVSEDTEVPEDTTVPADTTVSENTTVPEDTETPEDTTVSKDTTVNKTTTNTKNNTSTTNKTNTSSNNNKKENSTNYQKTEFDYQSLGYDTYEDFINHCTLAPDAATEEAMAQKIVAQIITNDMSDFDKVKTINDYMILNVRYDRENYEKDTIPATSYTAFGAMETGVAVCAGYAKMFNYLADAAGLESTYVTGYAGGSHAWNQVKVDGKWYNIDVTWNDPDCERHENGHYYCGCYQYFLISNELLEKTHTTRQSVKECNDSLDTQAILEGCPYSKEHTLCQTQEELNAIVKEMISKKQTSTSFITDITNRTTYKEMVVKALEACKIYNSYQLNITQDYRILREAGNWYCLTLNLEISADSVEELVVEAATTEAQVKQRLKEGFQNIKKYSTDTQEYFMLYVNDTLASDKYLVSRLLTWSFYEQDVRLDVWFDWEKVDTNINLLKLKFTKATDSNLVEYAYSVDALEGIIKRLKEHNVKKAFIHLFDCDYLLVGNNANEQRNNFINTYLKDLISEYCFEAHISGLKDEIAGQFSINIASNGHDTEYAYWKEYVLPTCSTEGLNVKYCNICGQIAEEQVVATNDSHTHYWDGDSKTRTLKCKACSYSGITEVCIDGIWGYYDVAKAIEYVNKINGQRENITLCLTDDWGNPIAVINPPQLTIDAALSEKAKTRVIDLIKCDFKYSALIENEGFYHSKYYANNNYVRGSKGGVDFYDENYSIVGVSCFCVDRDDSGFNFLDQYVFEFSK